MNALLSAASGKFTKALILGTFLPVTLVTVAFLWIVDPSLPGAGRVPAAIKTLDKEWQAVLLAFIVTGLSGILYNLNGTVLRFFSGYPWQDTWYGRFGVWWSRRRWQPVRTERDRARILFDAIRRQVEPWDPESERGAAVADMKQGRTDLSRIVNDVYPFREGLLLPTSLGNVIRNFEDYSRERYGISAVVLWPRLIQKIDATYATYIDDAKTAVDFTVNLSLLWGLAAGVTSWMVLRAFFGGAGIAAQVPLVWRTLLFAMLAVGFYRATIARVETWGRLVRSAIDLFRLKLLKDLGYEHNPRSIDAERAVWSSLAREWSFPDTKGGFLNYDAAPAAAAPQSSAVALTGGAKAGVLRGVRQPVQSPFPRMQTVLAVENTGTVPSHIRLTEILPAQWRFIPGSVTDSGNNITVVNETPLTLLVRDVRPGTVRNVAYNMQSLVP